MLGWPSSSSKQCPARLVSRMPVSPATTPEPKAAERVKISETIRPSASMATERGGVAGGEHAGVDRPPRSAESMAAYRSAAHSLERSAVERRLDDNRDPRRRRGGRRRRGAAPTTSVWMACGRAQPQLRQRRLLADVERFQDDEALRRQPGLIDGVAAVGRRRAAGRWRFRGRRNRPRSARRRSPPGTTRSPWRSRRGRRRPGRPRR